MPVRIPKAFPHRRICILCHRKKINGLYCPECRKVSHTVHSADYSIVRLFIQNPDVIELRDAFNFSSRKAVLNCLGKLRVPVRKYSLYYLFYNHDRLRNTPHEQLIHRYEFNQNSLRFLILYSQSLPTEADRLKYTHIRERLFDPETSLRSLHKEYGIHHELLSRCREFFTDRKILP